MLIALSLLVFLTPVADEIIGGFQFGAVRSQERKILYKEESIKNLTLLYSISKRTWVTSVVVPIEKQVVDWKDADTGLVVMQQIEFSAKGGWLSRSVAFNVVTRPYTFNGVSSTKEQFVALKRKLNFSYSYK